MYYPFYSTPAKIQYFRLTGKQKLTWNIKIYKRMTHTTKQSLATFPFKNKSFSRFVEWRLWVKYSKRTPFILENTISTNKLISTFWLWITLKLVSLYYQTQLWSNTCFVRCVVNCFKISILYYQIQRSSHVIARKSVVNCFKISIFVLSDTTCGGFQKVLEVLWIALKLVSLYYQIQPIFWILTMKRCCELL